MRAGGIFQNDERNKSLASITTWTYNPSSTSGKSPFEEGEISMAGCCIINRLARSPLGRISFSQEFLLPPPEKLIPLLTCVFALCPLECLISLLILALIFLSCALDSPRNIIAGENLHLRNMSTLECGGGFRIILLACLDLSPHLGRPARSITARVTYSQSGKSLRVATSLAPASTPANQWVG